MTSSYIASALCVAGWRVPLGIALKLVIRRDRNRVYVVLKFKEHVRVVHVTSSCPFAVRTQLDDECMCLMASADWEPTPIDLAGIQFENAVERIGGNLG